MACSDITPLTPNAELLPPSVRLTTDTTYLNLFALEILHLPEMMPRRYFQSVRFSHVNYGYHGNLCLGLADREALTALTPMSRTVTEVEISNSFTLLNRVSLFIFSLNTSLPVP